MTKPQSALLPLPMPSGWGEDALTEFLELAHRNRFATFFNKKAEFRRLAQIDACFVKVGDGGMNPLNAVTTMLFFRTQAAFRAACEHVMAGQIVEAFVMIRAVLETAGYALHIHRNPDLTEVWLRRHDDAASAKAVKSAFQISEVRKSIRAADRAGEKIFPRSIRTLNRFWRTSE